jgi:hypothetical protein
MNSNLFISDYALAYEMNSNLFISDYALAYEMNSNLFISDYVLAYEINTAKPHEWQEKREDKRIAFEKSLTNFGLELERVGEEVCIHVPTCRCTGFFSSEIDVVSIYVKSY